MNYVIRYLLFLIIISLCVSCLNANKDTDETADEQIFINEPMNNARMHDLLLRIDPDLKGQLGSWLLKYESLQVQVITDENADRMRVIVPIDKIENVDREEFIRLMQANFDSVLDARYSVANGVLWSAFIHPLSILSDEEFISGLAQAITAAATYGSTYSSGALIFRGGDSDEQQRDYYESIIEKGLKI